ncbi:hypothetical protein BD310DRAFT_1060 [Dichomitus squalens]|uniref:C3H1-type domain-containing protein n=1 Tax=Dichomitus squalens TaxID=114155 RepID=A0A4Q9QC14_9APHY|nr:hypothetical protein BD310DRAFT_1060 [Dichomitus squalens]
MTIEDPPWKKKTRPCPFYSQGRCLFADSCNFMHTVRIRRPDSVLGSEDSDQPDFRLRIDSPTPAKTVRFTSPSRSPRTTSLLLALGDVIQLEEEEEGDWEEGESGELESSSGEGSEGRTSGDYSHAGPVAASSSTGNLEPNPPGLHSGAVSDNSLRPTPILGLSEDARRLLHCIPSPPRDASPHLPEASITDGSATLVDGSSSWSGTPSASTAIIDEDVTVTRFRHSMTSQDPLHSNRESISSYLQDSPGGSAIVSDYFPSRRTSEAPDLYSPSRRASTVFDVHSPAPSCSGPAPIAPESLPLPLSPNSPPSDIPDIQPPARPTSTVPELRRLSILSHRSRFTVSSHDSISSGLLSPIDLTGARRISFASIPGALEREESFDSGYAEFSGPEPMRRSPPRSPRRLSTLSILSSPFGSPSARMAQAGAGAGVSGLFSPRFGAFTNSLTRDAHDGESGHSRNDSVDSQQFTREDAEVAIQVQRQSGASFEDIPADPEESSLFSALNASEFLGAEDDLLHAGEASFGSDDSMASLYDQYYTPTTHTRSVPDGEGEGEQEASPTVMFRSYAPHQSPLRDEQGDASPLDFSYLQETSPATVMGSQEPSPQTVVASQEPSPANVTVVPDSPEAAEEQSFATSDFYEELAYLDPEDIQEDISVAADDSQQAGPSTSFARSPSAASSLSEAPRVFSPITRPPSSASSVQVPNFSLPNSARNSIVFAAPSRAASPAASVLDESAAESTSRPASALSQHSGGLRRLSLQSAASMHSSQSSQSASRKVPFGFRTSVSDRSQLARPDSLRLKPPPLLAVENVQEDTQSRATTPLSPVEETPLTGSSTSSNPRKLKPLRLSMILSSSSSSLGSAYPSSSIPSLTTATTATTAFTPSSPTVSSDYSLSHNTLHYTFPSTQYHRILTT